MSARRVFCLTLLFGAASGALYPCGGPPFYPIGTPFASYDAMLTQVLGVDYYYGPSRPPEATFLYPLRHARPLATEVLWRLVEHRDTDWLPKAMSESWPGRRDSILRGLPSVSLESFRSALARGDLAAAEREARVVAEGVIDMPPPLADVYQGEFRRAIEFLELRPTLDGTPSEALSSFWSETVPSETAPSDPALYPRPLREGARIRTMSRATLAAYADSAPTSPRAPSLRYVALQEQMKREIPNGWGDEIRKAATPELWGRLHAAHDRWLADFPASPLLDLVKFSRLRLYRLSGDTSPAWQLLLGFYPDRRYARTVWEMRFFRGGDSTAANHPAVDDPLRVALTDVPAESSGWCAMWRDAEAGRPATWAVDLEERMLYSLAERLAQSAASRQESLPPCFPEDGAAPTPFWGAMRVMALMGAGRTAEARGHLPAVPASIPGLAPLRARFALEDGRWTDAVLTPGLDSAAALYLVRVLAPDSARGRLETRGPDWIRREAVLARAAGFSARGDWAGGAALVAKFDPGRAARWTTVARLARDTTFAGLVASARYLRGQRGRVLYPRDVDWYRSVEARLPPPDTAGAPPRARATGLLADEPERIRRHLLESTEPYLALTLYARALERAGANTPGLAPAVREADALYRLLTDWDWNHGARFWYRRLADGPEAKIIRRAGRLVPKAARP
ncbi:MAG: hypothetical protein HOP28_00505 [Gemmatimonadales bacterium]|nr:hypothetical protein [Gemmatimonadales bacterium]